VEENVGSTVSAVANIMSMKGISIQRSLDSSTPKAPVPGPLLNIKGITVQRVDEPGKATTPVKQVQGRVGVDAARAQQLTAAQLRQQEQAINRWANGCEHGCRICRKNGKNFTSFTKQGLLKHLEAEHEVSGKSGVYTERDYKEEFKCLNLITRASNTSCKECGARIKRIPTSLNMHLKKHGLNIRTYWLKHLKPPSMPVVNGTGGIPLRGRGSRPRGPRGGMMRGMSRPGIHKCTMPNCTRSFDNVTALNLHRSWHGRGGGRGMPTPRGRGRPSQDPVVVLNRVDGENQEGGDGEEMVMEMDPMDMLEVGIGDGDEERGEEVEVDLDNLEVVDDDGAPAFGDEELGDPIEITPVQEGDESVNTPDMTDTTHEENENGGLNTPEPEVDEETTNKEAQSDAESDIELVESYTAAVADPRMPIPLPDQTNDPPGTHIPPMTPPPITRLPTPIQDSEEKLHNNTQITVEKISSNDLDIQADIQADLGLGPDVEYDEDGAPIIKPDATNDEIKDPEIEKPAESETKPEEPKVNILDQIENEIQQKIKSQEAAKAAAKPKASPSNNIASESTDSKSSSEVTAEASEIKGIAEESKLESPNPEGCEREAKRIKLDGTPPQETNQPGPGTPIKPFDSGQPSLSSTNGYNPVDQSRNNSVLSPPFIASPTSQPLGPIGHLPTPNIPYSTQSAPPQISQTPYHVPISHHDPGRMHPNQPYPYEPMPNREHYYPMPTPIPNQPPMMQPMQQNFYSPPPPQIPQPVLKKLNFLLKNF